MKKSYIPPKSNIYVLKFEENIASSAGGTEGGDKLEGMMIIMFSHEVSPCRKYYTDSQAAVNTVGPSGSFMDYFFDMQGQNAPIGCLTPN